MREEGGTAGDGLRTYDGVVDSNLHITGRMSVKEMVHIDLRGGQWPAIKWVVATRKWLNLRYSEWSNVTCSRDKEKM